MRYLLDTNVVAEFTRPRADPVVLRRVEEAEADSVIAAITWQELTFGLLRLPAGRRRDALSEWLQSVGDRYRILPYDREAADWHGRERARLVGAGRPMPEPDGQIAAIAATRMLTLVTRNVRDFTSYRDLAVESWWD